MKKTLAIIMAMALLCMMAVGTTLTYFTDTDSDVNTMTVGKVEIVQHDTTANTGLKLYPVTAEPDSTTKLVPVANNGVNKEVTVENTGSEDAYVRTIFAFEMMKVDSNWESPVGDELILVGNNITMTDVVIERSGVRYIIGVCTYKNALTAESTTAPSLQQIYLASKVGNEFSTAVGGSYEILVLSQAVQTAGFAAADGKTAQAALDAAFGEVNATNATDWFNNLPAQ